MKPQSFGYRAPATLDEALHLLAEHGDEAKLLAGGQSLVPLLNLRLARPSLLIDINRLPGLDTLDGSGPDLRVGALVRHRALERPAVAGPLGRLLARVARAVAHPPIRARGTVCGSLAHADPAAEWSLAALACGATVEVVSVRGARRLGIDELLDSAFVTTLAVDEMITQVSFPSWPEGGVGAGFAERARTAGSFAEFAACAVVRAEAGRLASAGVALAGTAGRPVLLADVSGWLAGQAVTPATVAEAAARSAAQLRPPDAADAPQGYVRAAVAALVEDALGQACGEVEPAWRSS
jgi:carbon-monoxide dehydrogenase medium subunit